jgi:hypothetical protein
MDILLLVTLQLWRISLTSDNFLSYYEILSVVRSPLVHVFHTISVADLHHPSTAVDRISYRNPR